ncbi:hypothetical protein HH297_08195, partial [Xanthomonas sp. Kuri4-3]
YATDITAQIEAAQAMAELVERVARVAHDVDRAARDIADSNRELSQRSEAQARFVGQTTASIDALAGNVHANSRHAASAHDLAERSATVAQRGAEVIGDVVVRTQGIRQANDRIGAIVAVIDGIAFQTNILALNAAVEAARAGEQGRGFAVVASEVRTLAQRSAEAAKEIKGLIVDSSARVGEGSLLVGQAGDTMGSIVDSVQRVTGIMAEISAASQEQS